MYNSPKKAKRLYFDAIPRHVDDYFTHLEKHHDQDDGAQLENPAWHIHNGAPPQPEGHVTFGLLLNLVSVCNSEDPAVIWGFITRYAPDAKRKRHLSLTNWLPMPSRIIVISLSRTRAIGRRPTWNAQRWKIWSPRWAGYRRMPMPRPSRRRYEVGKRHDFENLRDWFKALYEVLLGQSQGPRFGSFVALYGKEESVGLISRVLAGKSAAAE